jgi:hypothetical protein
MIPFASQRGGGQDLATHLQNTYDNEVMEVVEIRGAIASDLHGAFKEWEVQAETLTRCQKYLYSMSINPDPQQGDLTREEYRDYIKRAEASLGLTDQPRAIVFHTKSGREHCHVVWSRIDADNQKAVHIAFDRDKLMRVTREFARDHFLDLPAGYEKSRKVGQETLYEREQKAQTGLSKDDHKAQVTEAWRHSDNPHSFVQALAEKGYILASGKRPYVLVDLYGGMHALSKLIDDKAVKTKDIRAFLEKDFPEDSLPSVEEAQDLVAAHRKIVEKSVNELRHADQLAALKHSQRDRRHSVEQQAAALQRQHEAAHEKLQSSQRDARHALRTQHASKIKATRAARREIPSTGLAGFLGKVSGVTALRKALHHYQDGKLVKVQRKERIELKRSQDKVQKAQDFRQKLQAQEMARQIKALDRIEKREVSSLMRDNRHDRRVKERGDDDGMPSLAKVAGFAQPEKTQVPDVLAAFKAAEKTSREPPPDLLSVFARAAKDAPAENQNGDSGRERESSPDEGPDRSGPDRGRR